MSGGAWDLHHLEGTAGELHARPLREPAARQVWWFDLGRPALVLGSTQPSSVVDDEAVRRHDTEVVRRRSGGGAVHLVPGETTWIDVIVPADDPLWVDDVGRSFGWLGAAWAEVLAALGATGVSVVEPGPLRPGPWSDLVCFGGLGPGEVTVGGRKVVGLSQRRTRAGARFQCALLHVWDPGALVRLLDLPEPERGRAARELAEVGGGVGAVASAVVVDLLVDALGRR